MMFYFLRAIICFILLLNCRALISQQKILTAEAPNYIGKTVAICDVITSAKYLASSMNKVTLLNMGGRYPNQAFTIVINGDARVNFPQPPEVHFLNKTVCVNGKVELYNGKPQIHILSPSEISFNEVGKQGTTKIVAAVNSTPVKKSADTMSAYIAKAGSVSSAQNPGVNRIAILKKQVQVRAGPGISFDVITVLKAGEAVDIREAKNGWCFISFDSDRQTKQIYRGFVSASVLQ